MILALHDFKGDWQITRQIEDRRAGRVGRLQGSAGFTPDDTGLIYKENGLLHFSGQPPLNATQTYHWRQDGAQLSIRFADGRDFHRFDPAQDQPCASHDCPPDWYKVVYNFSKWPTWSSTWTVSGPRKDYTSVTTYKRAG